MSLSLDSITTAEKPLPIFLIYGVPKVGKTSLAAEFPSPLYVNTPGESPPAGVDVATPGEIDSFESLMDLFEELLTKEHDRKTVIIDSLDGLEPIVWAETCRREGWQNIEEPGYGKGYLAADEVWREYLRAVEAMARAGINVVQIAHTEIYRFDSPTSEPFSRYGIKLQKRGAALVEESSSVIAFLNYRTVIVEKDVGFKKKVARGEGGGDRVIHLEERPGFTAGNRFGMPESLPFRAGHGYAALAKYLPSAAA